MQEINVRNHQLYLKHLLNGTSLFFSFFFFLPVCKEARFFVRSIEHLKHILNAHVQNGK